MFGSSAERRDIRSGRVSTQSVRGKNTCLTRSRFNEEFNGNWVARGRKRWLLRDR